MKSAQQAWLRALRRVASIDQHPEVTLPMLIGQLAETHGAAMALVSETESFTYREFSGRCNQYARWGLDRGLGAGDSVWLLMPNCAEYLAVWLGLTRIGVTVALGNTHLAANALTHSIKSAAPRLMIVDSTLAGMLNGAFAPSGIPYCIRGPAGPHAMLMDGLLLAQSTDPLSPAECPEPSLDSTALYIYTSGTTGLPKAAKVSHYRVLQWSQWFAGMMNVGPSDRIYDCLPLYHSIGGVVAPGAMLVSGATVVIRRRFSATDFWQDVSASGCTLFQYIGELCRYLVNAPRHEDEGLHGLRLACGNGLRPEVWKIFQERFRIPQILEYYAATEANFSLYNCEGEPGAIGRIPPYLAHRLPVELLRFDVDSGAPLRNDRGFCERCGADEIGEAVGFIPAGTSARQGRFEGYADTEASGRKILRDVFTSGDSWYRTGDLMRRDARGFYYFVDRVGETYRWKGENVSTLEVAATLASFPGVMEAAVYGVHVPGADGRAGMAALCVSPEFDLADFRNSVHRGLATYARPLFLRLLSRLDSTSTFRPRTRELMLAGFDPESTSDPVYFDSHPAGKYVQVDAGLYATIVDGGIRV